MVWFTAFAPQNWITNNLDIQDCAMWTYVQAAGSKHKIQMPMNDTGAASFAWYTFKLYTYCHCYFLCMDSSLY